MQLGVRFEMAGVFGEDWTFFLKGHVLEDETDLPVFFRADGACCGHAVCADGRAPDRRGPGYQASVHCCGDGMPGLGLSVSASWTTAAHERGSLQDEAVEIATGRDDEVILRPGARLVTRWRALRQSRAPEAEPDRAE